MDDLIFIALVVGAVLLAYWMADARRDRVLAERGTTTEGTVVTVQQNWLNEYSPFSSVVRFKDGQGLEHRAMVDRKLVVGTRVRVCYDPLKPERAEITQARGD